MRTVIDELIAALSVAAIIIMLILFTFAFARADYCYDVIADGQSIVIAEDGGDTKPEPPPETPEPLNPEDCVDQI